MKVSFASSSFAKVASYYSRGELGILHGLKLECVSCAGSLRDLSCECGGYCMLAPIKLVPNERGRGNRTILSLLLP